MLRAASRAAPRAAALSGPIDSGRPRAFARAVRAGRLAAPPPETAISPSWTPREAKASAIRANSSPEASTKARASCGTVVSRVRPCTVPVAAGSLSRVPEPRRYGTTSSGGGSGLSSSKASPTESRPVRRANQSSAQPPAAVPARVTQVASSIG